MMSSPTPPRKQGHQQRWRTEERFRWLASSQGGAVVASTALLPQAAQWSSDMKGFRAWDDTFSEHYHTLRTGIDAARQRSHASYTSLLDTAAEDGNGYDALRNVDLIRDKWKALRGDGVEHRWEMERFFAREGGPASRTTLGYVGDGGHHATYDHDQWHTLTGQTGARATANGTTLHGHHINDVSSGLERDFRDVRHLDNPQNIRLMTNEAHLRDPTHGHGGSFSNYTTGEASEVDVRFDAIRSDNKENVFAQAAGREAGLALGTGLVLGSAAAAIRLYQLRSDPRPWKQKTGLMAAAFALKGGEASVVAFAALHSRGLATKLVYDSADSIADNMGEAFSGDALTEILGSSAGIAAAMTVRTGLRAFREHRAGVSISRIGTSAGQQIMVVAGETAAFILLGVALDAVVPDPTGLVIATRIVYSLGKVGYSHQRNRQSQADCAERRMDVLYGQATAGLPA